MPETTCHCRLSDRSGITRGIYPLVLATVCPNEVLAPHILKSTVLKRAEGKAKGRSIGNTTVMHITLYVNKKLHASVVTDLPSFLGGQIF